MKKLAYPGLVFVLVVVAFTVGGQWGRSSNAPTTSARKILYYACPMHPQYHSDRAGDCPSCGMRLEAVYAEPSANATGTNSAPRTAGTVQVSAERQQAIGVRLGEVERLAGMRTLRTTGRVAANDNATYPVVAGVAGLVREVRNPTVGSHVHKNEVLASFYAPDLLSAAQNYLAAIITMDQLRGQERLPGANNANVQRFADALRNIGLSDDQIEDLAKTRQLSPHITVTSPVDGFILQRNVLIGQRIDRGVELYRIADLRRVWILADVYEAQMPFIHAGMRAQATAAQRNRQFDAIVSSAQPTFDEATRTLKVRLEVANDAAFTLKPGMFMDVDFDVKLPETLVVPADAIVDTGLRKTVFVDKGSGYFEPRLVETGWRIGDNVEVLRGLMAGERIVIAGTFLIDSESRMKAAAAGVFGAAVKDPVCGMDVDEKRAAAAGRVIEHEGRKFYFCSDECEHKFQAEPGKYAAK